MAPALMGFGTVFILIGAVWLLVTAFKKSFGWGLACALLPVTMIVFVALHWAIAWRPFVALCIGAVCYALGASMMGQIVPEQTA